MAGRRDTAEEFGWFDRTAMSVLRRFRRYERPLVVLLPLTLALLLLPLGVGRLMEALDAPKLAMAILSVLLLVPGLCFAFMVNRALTVSMDHNKAHAAGNLDEVARLRRLMDGSGPPRTPFERANRELGDAELHLHFERWAEAGDRFARIDREALQPRTRPGTLAQQGYVTAHAGQPDLGVELIERAEAEARALPEYPAEKQWFMRARLGIALSLAGRHEDAVTVLEEVLGGIDDYRGEPIEWTAALFFIGRSYRACGNFDDAMRVLEAAAQEGEGPFVPRAKAALDLATGSPLRDGGQLREPEVEPDSELASERILGAKRAR